MFELNAKIQLLQQIDLILNRYYPPILIFFSIILNGISFYIYTRPCLIKTSAGFYYSILAIIETLAVICGSFKFFSTIDFDYNLLDKSIYLCKIFKTSIYILTQLASWILVIISIDRLFLIKFPHKCIGSKYRKIRKLCVVLLFFIVVMINMPNLYFFNLINKNTTLNDTIVCEKVCEFDSNIFYNNIILNSIDLALTCFVPFIFMTWSGIIVSIIIIKSKKKITTTPSNSIKNKYKFLSILLARNFFFLLFNLPIYVTLFISNNTIDTSDLLKTNRIKLLVTISNICVYINFSFSFFVHVTFNKLFRELFANIFLKKYLRSSIKQNNNTILIETTL